MMRSRGGSCCLGENGVRLHCGYTGVPFRSFLNLALPSRGTAATVATVIPAATRGEASTPPIRFPRSHSAARMQVLSRLSRREAVTVVAAIVLLAAWPFLPSLQQ